MPRTDGGQNLTRGPLSNGGEAPIKKGVFTSWKSVAKALLAMSAVFGGPPGVYPMPVHMRRSEDSGRALGEACPSKKSYTLIQQSCGISPPPNATAAVFNPPLILDDKNRGLDKLNVSGDSPYPQLPLLMHREFIDGGVNPLSSSCVVDYSGWPEVKDDPRILMRIPQGLKEDYKNKGVVGNGEIERLQVKIKEFIFRLVADCSPAFEDPSILVNGQQLTNKNDIKKLPLPIQKGMLLLIVYQLGNACDFLKPSITGATITYGAPFATLREAFLSGKHQAIKDKLAQIAEYKPKMDSAFPIDDTEVEPLFKELLELPEVTFDEMKNLLLRNEHDFIGIVDTDPLWVSHPELFSGNTTTIAGAGPDDMDLNKIKTRLGDLIDLGVTGASGHYKFDLSARLNDESIKEQYNQIFEGITDEETKVLAEHCLGLMVMLTEILETNSGNLLVRNNGGNVRLYQEKYNSAFSNFTKHYVLPALNRLLESLGGKKEIASEVTNDVITNIQKDQEEDIAMIPYSSKLAGPWSMFRNPYSYSWLGLLALTGMGAGLLERLGLSKSGIGAGLLERSGLSKLFSTAVPDEFQKIICELYLLNERLIKPVFGRVDLLKPTDGDFSNQFGMVISDCIAHFKPNENKPDLSSFTLIEGSNNDQNNLNCPELETRSSKTNNRLIPVQVSGFGIKTLDSKEAIPEILVVEFMLGHTLHCYKGSDQQQVFTEVNIDSGKWALDSTQENEESLKNLGITDTRINQKDIFPLFKKSMDEDNSRYQQWINLYRDHLFEVLHSDSGGENGGKMVIFTGKNSESFQNLSKNFAKGDFQGLKTYEALNTSKKEQLMGLMGIGGESSMKTKLEGMASSNPNNYMKPFISYVVMPLIYHTAVSSVFGAFPLSQNQSIPKSDVGVRMSSDSSVARAFHLTGPYLNSTILKGNEKIAPGINGSLDDWWCLGDTLDLAEECAKLFRVKPEDGQDYEYSPGWDKETLGIVIGVSLLTHGFWEFVKRIYQCSQPEEVQLIDRLQQNTNTGQEEEGKCNKTIAFIFMAVFAVAIMGSGPLVINSINGKNKGDDGIVEGFEEALPVGLTVGSLATVLYMILTRFSKEWEQNNRKKMVENAKTFAKNVVEKKTGENAKTFAENVVEKKTGDSRVDASVGTLSSPSSNGASRSDARREANPNAGSSLPATGLAGLQGGPSRQGQNGEDFSEIQEVGSSEEEYLC